VELDGLVGRPIAPPKHGRAVEDARVLDHLQDPRHGALDERTRPTVAIDVSGLAAERRESMARDGRPPATSRRQPGTIGLEMRGLRAIASGPGRAMAVMTLGLLVAACGILPVTGDGTVPAGPLGPIAPGHAGGPPIECRGVPLDQCRQSVADPGRPDIVRIIVTCTTTCTPAQGEYRIDALRADGRIESLGGGGYASAPAAPAFPQPAPPAPT
jgi:hypothetical protein